MLLSQSSSVHESLFVCANAMSRSQKSKAATASREQYRRLMGGGEMEKTFCCNFLCQSREQTKTKAKPTQWTDNLESSDY